jgi:hypothetical protein
MKKNQQLAKQVNQVHEQWARDNGYRKKRQATSDKQQAIDETVPYNDIEEAQASSFKRQAPGRKSNKHQASSTKAQASSQKTQAQ